MENPNTVFENLCLELKLVHSDEEIQHRRRNSTRIEQNKMSQSKSIYIWFEFCPFIEDSSHFLSIWFRRSVVIFKRNSDAADTTQP